MLDLPLITPALVLRRFGAGDAPRIRELNGEPSTSRWLPSHVYASLQEAHEALAFLIASYAAPGDPRRGPVVLAIEVLGTGQLIGHVGFSPLDGDVEVSYAVAEAMRARGYGAQALSHACRWACRTFGLPCVVAHTASANVASRRTLDQVGFVHLDDEVRRFQGAPEAVSRYRWDAPAA